MVGVYAVLRQLRVAGRDRQVVQRQIHVRVRARYVNIVIMPDQDGELVPVEACQRGYGGVSAHTRSEGYTSRCRSAQRQIHVRVRARYVNIVIMPDQDGELVPVEACQRGYVGISAHTPGPNLLRI